MIYAICYTHTEPKIDRSSLAHTKHFAPRVIHNTSADVQRHGGYRPAELPHLRQANKQHKMADKAEVMKWFAGREIEVLDDQKGRTTVSAWREQLLNAAARMCGATGRKMLHGEFPKIEADEYYTPGHIMNIINDVFKRSKTREKLSLIHI